MATIEELKLKHPRHRIVETSQGLLMFRPPSRQEYRKFKVLAVSDDPQQNAIAQETMMLDCIVNMSREELSGLLDRAPGLDSHKGVVQALRELTGSVDGDEGKG